ncbi:gluconokinase [Sphaerisporangium sp. TRM90804]|uniref:gluconokinase n=1 Tax=Sphaerisporangium sp. TRM90804 TaxID=3031113 RepID=UPI002447A40C|nr:gluconokinase [Sphaerisporangium sp. TRM90804]MDH2425879.1 gluconokinase [Sphaerisporangium sp. TRM90804]
MGVSGSGKTTVGQAISQSLGLPFADADDFHSPENIAKMSAGVPLEDADRLPWLRAVGRWLGEHAATGGVAGCSALKRSYRDILRESAPGATFVHLHGDPELIRRRVAAREGHFMPTSLLDSQLATLEPLGPDERAVLLDFAKPVPELVRDYLAAAQEDPQTVTAAGATPKDQAGPPAGE